MFTNCTSVIHDDSWRRTDYCLWEYPSRAYVQRFASSLALLSLRKCAMLCFCTRFDTQCRTTTQRPNVRAPFEAISTNILTSHWVAYRLHRSRVVKTVAVSSGRWRNMALVHTHCSQVTGTPRPHTSTAQ